jgi:hypothetical protein
MAETICRRLKCSNRDTGKIHFLVRHHVRPRSLFTALHEQKAGPRAVTRFFMKCAGDMLGKKAQPSERSTAFTAFLNQLMVDFENDFKLRTSNPRLITGHDLTAEFELEPSPLFKKILARVEEERLSRNDMTRRQALTLVRKLIRDKWSIGDR